ncbi:MAG: thiamine phosphate synthase [Defluviitaleaceae bacterium]|nr:thiamine phosphate synthase [Defluviitaleaceae bacterium]
MKPDYSLYLVTDRELMSSADICQNIQQAINGGVTMVQLREKTADSREFYETALKVREVTARANVPLIINDRADIALAVDADGLHLGQNDLPCKTARKILGKNKIIGVSANNLPAALAAVNDGADYLGVGAMFPTGTKTDVNATSTEDLRAICKNISIPVVAIGGINKQNAHLLADTGIAGIAVVSAIVAHEDPAAAASELLNYAKR